MSIERLTSDDQLMLWPDEIWPQDIGALAVLEGSNLFDTGGRLRLQAVRDAVAARLHLVPRFRQLLYVPPRRLGPPLWLDAPGFGVNDHVQVFPLAAPGDETELLRAVEQIRRRRLDPSRPLWEMWLLTGLQDRRIGLFVRLHHCIADGVAGVAAMAAFLDTAPGAIPEPPRPWTPAPAPTEAELLADQRSRRLRRRGEAVSAAVHPLITLQRVLATWPATWELIAGPRPPVTSLDAVVGEDRHLALVRTGLGLVRSVAHASQATENDVLLT